MTGRAPGAGAVQPYPGDIAALERSERENHGHGRGFTEVTAPESTSVVLGRTTPLGDVIVAACEEDRVPLYRRRGGGGAVVLATGMIVITSCFRVDSLPDVETLMSDLSAVVVRALSRLAPGGKSSAVARSLCIRGFGDVCVGDKKILGSSLYLKRGVGLYQASLLVRDCSRLVCRYLAHPSREPAYRAGRAHSQFITSIDEHGFPTSLDILRGCITDAFEAWMAS